MDPPIERPHKRLKTLLPRSPRRDAADLERDRQRNDQRLKGALESIFSKYSRDFTNVGDEIDLETGEVVVDNGHIARMRHEQDIGASPAGRMIRSLTAGIVGQTAELLRQGSEASSIQDSPYRSPVRRRKRVGIYRIPRSIMD